MKSRYYPVSLEVFSCLIEPLIKQFHNRSGRPTRVSHYKFFCGALYVLRTGVSWRDLPATFGPWHTIYTRFKRWSENGLFWHILYALQQRKQVQVNIAWVDSTTICMHRHGGGSLKKRPSSQRAWTQRLEYKNSCQPFSRLSQKCLPV